MKMSQTLLHLVVASYLPSPVRGTTSGEKNFAISSLEAYLSFTSLILTEYGNPRNFNVMIEFSSIRCSNIVSSYPSHSLSIPTSKSREPFSC